MRSNFRGVFVLFCLLFHAASTLAANAGKSVGGSVVLLNENNWQDVLDKEWLVQFHAPWCPACRALVTTWDTLSQSADELGISVGKVDVTSSPALSGRFFVTALPTIFHVRNGEFRQYKGPRDASALKDMVAQRTWKSIEPVSGWTHPNSYSMGAVAHFFKLSHYLKEANTYLHDVYNCPVWLAYGLFAVLTIFVGALLGLMFVCLVDLMWPPRKHDRKTFDELAKEPLIEDYPNEELEDLSGGDDAVSDADASSTSDGEKNSDSDAANKIGENKDEKKSDTAEQKSTKPSTSTDSPDVRKRKPRKAD